MASASSSFRGGCVQGRWSDGPTGRLPMTPGGATDGRCGVKRLQGVVQSSTKIRLHDGKSAGTDIVNFAKLPRESDPGSPRRPVPEGFLTCPSATWWQVASSSPRRMETRHRPDRRPWASTEIADPRNDHAFAQLADALSVPTPHAVRCRVFGTPNHRPRIFRTKR